MSAGKPDTSLAALEHQLRSERALGVLSEAYVHRAVREDSLGFLVGRDAILADWVAKDRVQVAITHDFRDMIAFEVNAPGEPPWCGHRWVQRDGNKIIAEVLVENDGMPKRAPKVHPPLGELRAGRGQFDAGTQALLPADFPEAARPLAHRLHQAWNGRAFNLYSEPWLPKLIRALPDANFYFERALTLGNECAILWRVHGHHFGGQRIRLIGSSVVSQIDGNIATDDTIIDFAALEAQLARELISYA